MNTEAFKSNIKDSFYHSTLCSAVLIGEIMRKTLVVAVFALLLCSYAVALSIDQSASAEQLFQKYFDKKGELTVEGNKLVGEINSLTEKLPLQLKQLFGNERMEFHIKLSSGKTQTIGVVTKDSKIEEAKAKPIASPNFIIKTDEKTARKIVFSEQAAKEFLSAVNDKKIEIAATGWREKMKLWLFLFFVKTSEGIGSITARVLFFVPKW